MSGFTKLVPEIIQSSIWNEDSDTRVVWITLIATRDENGYVRGDVKTIARMANVSIEAAAKALDLFQRPDPSSHTPDNDGRRIEPMHGGWLVLNHEIYRADEYTRRERCRNRVRKHRERKQLVDNGVTVTLRNVTSVLPSVSVSASVSESEEDKRTKKRAVFVPPTPEEAEDYAHGIDFTLDGSQFCDYYEARGWMIGKTKMKDWRAAVRTWRNRHNQSNRQTDEGPDFTPLQVGRQT